MIEKTLIEWLVSKKYRYFRNFHLGGRFPTLIAVKDREIIAFEVRKRANEISTAMGQCLFYLTDANKVYIVIPEKEKSFLSNSVIDILKNQGIGLMSADGSIKILVTAKDFRKNNSSLIKEVNERTTATNGKSKKGNVRERIIKILKEHPEGLTTVDISKYIGMTRHSIAKYVYQLLGEGLIYQKNVGASKLCYLKVKK
jgi:hypothetical protein